MSEKLKTNPKKVTSIGHGIFSRVNRKKCQKTEKKYRGQGK